MHSIQTQHSKQGLSATTPHHDRFSCCTHTAALLSSGKGGIEPRMCLRRSGLTPASDEPAFRYKSLLQLQAADARKSNCRCLPAFVSLLLGMKQLLCLICTSPHGKIPLVDVPRGRLLFPKTHTLMNPFGNQDRVLNIYAPYSTAVFPRETSTSLTQSTIRAEHADNDQVTLLRPPAPPFSSPIALLHSSRARLSLHVSARTSVF